MKQARKRISLILAVCMLITMLPVTAYAETGKSDDTITQTVKPYVISTLTTGAAITVGTQEGVLYEGVESADKGMFSHVTYRLETENISEGTYGATVDNLPTGVSMEDTTVNIDAEGKGTFELAGNTATVAGTTELTLTITDESLRSVTSEPFELTIIDKEFIETIMELFIKSLEIQIPYEIIGFLSDKSKAYVEIGDEDDFEAAIEDALEEFMETGEKFKEYFDDESLLSKYLKDLDGLIVIIDELLEEYKAASDELADAAKPFFKDEAWEYAQLKHWVYLLSNYRISVGLQIGKIDMDDFKDIQIKLSLAFIEISDKYFGPSEDDIDEIEEDAISNGDWETLGAFYTEAYDFLYNILEEYGISGGNADEDDDNGGSNGGGKDKDDDNDNSSGPVAPAVPTVPTPSAETVKKPVGEILNDVGTHWALNSIQFVYDRGIMTGTSAEQFSPDARMNRGMLITALGRLAGINALDFTSGSFNDVDMSSYYGPYAEWSLINNITRGTGNNNFSPDNPVTREELAVILVNFVKAMRYYLPSGEGAQSFADGSAISPWAMEAIEIMRNANIMQGDPGNNFNPKAPATRAEIAAVLQRFIEYMGL